VEEEILHGWSLTSVIYISRNSRINWPGNSENMYQPRKAKGLQVGPVTLKINIRHTLSDRRARMGVNGVLSGVNFALFRNHRAKLPPRVKRGFERTPISLCFRGNSFN
jgi:hypothetical protein